HGGAAEAQVVRPSTGQPRGAMRGFTTLGRVIQASHVRVALLVMVVAPGHLVSQVDTASARYTLHNLPPEAALRVHTHNRSILFGTFLRASGDSLFLAGPLGAGTGQTIPLRNIVALWFRQGSRAMPGFLLGT